ncbi:aminoacyl-tRNA deacylase [Sediminitomix flava]|uniref:Ala-tRNA(Pro) deacylase n=1 Tax=Sediminitomix flava TaxID=379075 RepID=A0A315ZIQ3_SEDFL|nr:YbaK/EbsC family protein [Sediminitomix flava]PWJ45093.1 Ala-tRNA(Pro) deacylase [Sediminitomix flava]
MINQLLKEFLDSNNIDYQIISHSETHTNMQAAASSHISGHKVAKTVMVKADDRICMVVLPASYLINFNQLSEALGVNDCHLIGENLFKDLFKGNVETGAMSPFGNIHNMDVYVAESLIHKERIAFNAGNHHEMILMKYEDFNKLVKPKSLHFSYPIHRKSA